jgi:hypothetical protein
MGESERRRARSGLALLLAAGAATTLRAGPLAWGTTPERFASRPCPTGSPASSGPRDLALIWVDVLGSARFAFPEASREILSLLDRMGVQAAVREGSPRTVSGESELTLILLPERPPGARLDRSVMGATHRTREGVRAVWVYAGGVGATLGLDVTRVGDWRAQDRKDFAIALGRVVVHELVHAVTPDRPHLKGGLMAQRMNRRLLLASNLVIDAGTAEAFRLAVSGRPTAPEAVATMPDAVGEPDAARP